MPTDCANVSEIRSQRCEQLRAPFAALRTTAALFPAIAPAAAAIVLAELLQTRPIEKGGPLPRRSGMYEFLEYQVGDAMTYHPVTIARETSLAEVEALFELHDFNCLPVAEEGALLGIVTKMDALKAFAFTPRTMVPRYAEIMRQRAETVMTHEPITMTADVSLTRVLQQMVETRYRSFPVVVGALLIGIISRRDVLWALGRAAAGERPRSGPAFRRKEGRCQWTIAPSSNT